MINFRDIGVLGAGVDPNTLTNLQDPTGTNGAVLISESGETWVWNEVTDLWVMMTSGSGADKFHSNIVATAPYDPLLPLTGWVAPTAPIAGNTVEVKFTDGTVANYTYNGSDWELNFQTSYFVTTAQDISTFDFDKYPTGYVFQTSGFTVPNDGGGAVYTITTGLTANDIDIFALTDGRFAKLNTAETLNLLQVGISSLNVDNSNIVNRAIQISNNVELAKAGTYLFTNTIYLKSNTYLKLTGDVEFKSSGNDRKLLISFQGEHLNNDLYENVTIDGGTFNSDGFRTITVPNTTVYDDYLLLLKKCNNLTIKNAKFTNTLKYCISIGEVSNLKLDNIIFATPSDGIHIEGPAKDLKITNISGYTGDDFVALSCANWVANKFSDGDIENVFIDNISISQNPSPSHNSSGIAIWAGNDGLGEVGDNYYTVRNVVISNVYGNTESSALVNLARYGVSGNVSNGSSFGGSIENIHIKNVDGVSDLGGNTITVLHPDVKNITLENIYGVGTSDIITFDALGISNLKILNSYLKSTSSRCINFTTSSSFDRVVIDNCYFENSLNGGSFINLNQSGTLDLFISNSKFKGTARYNGRVDVQKVCFISLNNCSFENSYRSFLVAIAGVKFKVEGVKVHDIDIFIENNSSGATEIQSENYVTSGASTAVDMYRATGAGSISLIRDNKHDDIEIINFNISLSNSWPVGTKKTYKNTNASPITITPASGTIEGAANLNLNLNDSVSIFKHTTSSWLILARN